MVAVAANVKNKVARNVRREPAEDYAVCKLVEGQEYTYASPHPISCHGHRYRLLRFVVDIPSYQKKVLVEGLTGPDIGAFFVLSEVTFAVRFDEVVGPPLVAVPLPQEPVQRGIVAGKVAGKYDHGAGV